SCLSNVRRREHDRDVARALLDLESATLSARAETLERRTLVDVRVLHVQVLLVEVLAVAICLHLRVGHGRRDKLVDRLTGALRCELQDRQGLFGLLSLDERNDTTSLLRGHADVSHACDGLHHFSLLYRHRLSGDGPSCRPSRGRGRCGWARTRPACGRPWSRRQTQECACVRRGPR